MRIVGPDSEFGEGFDAAARHDAAEFKRLDHEIEQQLGAIKLLRDKLRLILPLAKGYAVEHPVGSNGAYVSAAERALDDTDEFVAEVADTDRRFRQR